MEPSSVNCSVFTGVTEDPGEAEGVGAPGVPAMALSDEASNCVTMADTSQGIVDCK